MRSAASVISFIRMSRSVDGHRGGLRGRRKRSCIGAAEYPVFFFLGVYCGTRASDAGMEKGKEKFVWRALLGSYVLELLLLQLRSASRALGWEQDKAEKRKKKKGN